MLSDHNSTNNSLMFNDHARNKTEHIAILSSV